MTDPCAPLAALDADYEALARRVGAATWLSYAGGPEAETAEDPAEVRTEFGALFDRAAPVLAACAAETTDPVTARQLELWRRSALAWRLDADPEAVRLRVELERRVNEHVFEREGTRYSRADLSRMARSDDEHLRRLGLELRGDLHRAVIDDTWRLVEVRRHAAAAVGGGTYAELLLAAQGVPVELLDPLLDDLERRTRDAWEAVLLRARAAAGLAADAPLRSSDLQWLFDKLGGVPDDRWPKERAWPAVVETLADLGIDVEALPLVRVEGDFGYGGQTIAVAIPDDVRMMINPLPGSRIWGTLLHETGHALQGVFTDVPHGMLKGYEWLAGASAPAYSEAMAELLGLLVGRPEFLARRTDLSDDERARFLAVWRARTLLGLRAHLVDVAVERALYVEGSDVEAVEREATRRYLGVERPADAPPTWAATAFLAAYPCYMQNYVLADVAAAQLHRALATRFGPDWLENTEVGAFLREALWRDGETREWTDRVRDATGAELSVDALLELLQEP
ncbi:MAG: hypothetical protein JXB32_13350 [Deltaproteobacteria bacterium]|nr:hypothetical protein [Deltaproteobacteria bacterium]